MKSIDELSIMADTVKENISALETGQALGLDIRKNRCKCPVHNGVDYNCVLDKGKRGFHCYVCAANGDAIALVQAVTGMGFIDTLKWFNGMFSLGMDIDSPMNENKLKQAKKRLKRKRDDEAFKQRIERLDYDTYLALSSRLIQLEQQRDDNRPRRYSEDWNNEFCEAVQLIPEMKRYMDYFAIQCTVVRT